MDQRTDSIEQFNSLLEVVAPARVIKICFQHSEIRSIVPFAFVVLHGDRVRMAFQRCDVAEALKLSGPISTTTKNLIDALKESVLSEEPEVAILDELGVGKSSFVVESHDTDNISLIDFIEKTVPQIKEEIDEVFMAAKNKLGIANEIKKMPAFSTSCVDVDSSDLWRRKRLVTADL